MCLGLPVLGCIEGIEIIVTLLKPVSSITTRVLCIKYNVSIFVFLGSADGLLKSWNLDICDFADNFVGHTGAITCLAISSDHSFAISGSVDTTLKVWSLILATIITNYKVV